MAPDRRNHNAMLPYDRAEQPRRHSEAAPRTREGRHEEQRGSASLAVVGVLPAVRAELAQLETIGVVAAVLACDVVTVLAHLTRHCDLWTDIGGGHGAVPLPAGRTRTNQNL